ncbi:MAG: DUF429 domain-containing protein [Sulfolobales archaeon]
MESVGGLDLAASESRCSGFAVLEVDALAIVQVRCLYRDDEILDEILRSRIRLVAVDAPLSPEPVYRRIDRIARSMGYPVLPPVLGPMKLLVRRAWRIKDLIERRGISVIETHPRSAMISSRAKDLYDLLNRFRIRIDLDIDLKRLKKDLVDAIIASVVAFCYMTGKCSEEVRAEDGVIYLIKSLY